MAHVETGHIHLGTSILHHTGGWETKTHRLGVRELQEGSDWMKGRDVRKHGNNFVHSWNSDRAPQTDVQS